MIMAVLVGGVGGNGAERGYSDAVVARR